MAQQDFQLNDNANFVFQYGNKVYKLGVNIINGVITLEKLKKNQKKYGYTYTSKGVKGAGKGENSW